MIEQMKSNFDDICGWGVEGNTNRQSIMLSNIIRRKTNIGSLPQISDRKPKMTSNQKQKPSFKSPKINKPTLNLNNIAKQKERHENYKDYSSRKLVALDIDFENPYKMNNHLEKLRQIQNLGNTIDQYETSISKGKNRKLLFLNPPKSNFQRSEQNKHYLKLNTLEMRNDLKKQFREEFHPKIEKKYNKRTLSEDRSQDRLFGFKKQKINMLVLEKINQKFRQTFVKNDIFNKQNQKRQKLDKLQNQFSDKIIFCSNSIILNKKNMFSTLNCYADFQKSPQRYQINFK